MIEKDTVEYTTEINVYRYFCDKCKKLIGGLEEEK